MVECQSSRLGEDVWYVNEEKQDQINLWGRSSQILSDCGKNLKGAVNELEIETSK